MAYLASLSIVCGGIVTIQKYEEYYPHSPYSSIYPEDVFPISGAIKPGDQVPFDLTTTVQLKDEASCFHFLYDFEGAGDKLSTQWILPKGKLHGTLSKHATWEKRWNGRKYVWKKIKNTVEVNVHSCQVIHVEPMLRFKSSKSCPWPSERLQDYDLKTNCQIRSAQHILIPVWNWLKQQEHKPYPNVEFVDNKIFYDWGDVVQFDCRSKKTTTEANFEYNVFKNKETENVISGEQKADEWNMFERKAYSHNLSLNMIKCNSWKIQTKLKIIFWYKTTKTITFEKTISQKKNAKNILAKKKTMQKENANKTLILFEAETNGDITCLDLSAVIYEFSDKYKHTSKPIKIISAMDRTPYIDVSEYLENKCEDAKILVTFTASGKEFSGHFYSIPTVKTPKAEDHKVSLELEEEKFKNCSNTIYEIQCRNKTSNEITSTDQQVYDFRLSNQNGNPEFDILNLHEKLCQARAYIRKSFTEESRNFDLGWTKDFSDKPIPEIKKFTTDIVAIVAPIAISITIALIIFVSIIFLINNNKKQTKKRKNSIKVSKIKKAKANRVAHCIIQKNEDLLDNLLAVIDLQYEANQEYENILKHTEIHITKKETTHTAHEDTSMKRNRYSDMVPYDSNMVTLSTATGTPHSTYINASPIKFSGCPQEFLAVQAPRPNMFSSFWQMVDDKNVSIIVMITGLQEGNKVKAHQYWPDKDSLVEETDNGFRIHYISHTFPGTYYHRTLKMMNDKGKERDIEMLQCTAWQDMSAPDDTKILLDLLYKSMELVQTRPGPILVHCSAGVGRTGTFIGLYKLVNDFGNEAVKEIDFFETVVTMREQRMMMVQKPMQYYYMIRCLTDYVSANESIYE